MLASRFWFAFLSDRDCVYQTDNSPRSLMFALLNRPHNCLSLRIMLDFEVSYNIMRIESMLEHI